MITYPVLRAFIFESNHIEGIVRPPTDAELQCTSKFLDFDELSTTALQWLVECYEPGAQLRSERGMDVQVGNYIPPAGGLLVPYRLVDLLEKVPAMDPWDVYVQYECLHPFTDGNGRSGRALWLWTKMRHGYTGERLFLREWHFNTLEKFSNP